MQSPTTVVSERGFSCARTTEHAADCGQRPLAGLHLDLQAVFGPEREGRLGGEVLPWDGDHAPAAGDRAQQDRRLEHRELLADTQARSAAEREIGKAWQALRQAVEPAVGTERFGILEPAGIALDDPRHDVDV